MTQVTVHLSRIRLKQAIKNAGVENPASITKLTLTGTITKNDFYYIGEQMAKTLQELDMSKASVVKDMTFYECTGLTTVIIPDLVDKISDYAFNGCTGLKSLTIPCSVTEIGEDALKDCNAFITVHPDNPVYTSENGKLKFKKVTVSGRIGKLKWSLSNRVLTIQTTGTSSDYDNYLKGWRPGSGLSSWYTFRKLIEKVVFKGNRPSICSGPSSVTFESWTVLGYGDSSLDALNVQAIINRAFKGYTSLDLWSFKSWFSVQIPRMLMDLKRDTNGHPGDMTFDEWCAILERMAFCLSEMNPQDWVFEDDKMCAYREEMKNEGFALLCKHFGHLWW